MDECKDACVSKCITIREYKRGKDRYKYTSWFLYKKKGERKLDWICYDGGLAAGNEDYLSQIKCVSHKANRGTHCCVLLYNDTSFCSITWWFRSLWTRPPEIPQSNMTTHYNDYNDILYISLQSWYNWRDADNCLKSHSNTWPDWRKWVGPRTFQHALVYTSLSNIYSTWIFLNIFLGQ